MIRCDSSDCAYFSNKGSRLRLCLWNELDRRTAFHAHHLRSTSRCVVQRRRTEFPHCFDPARQQNTSCHVVRASCTGDVEDCCRLLERANDCLRRYVPPSRFWHRKFTNSKQVCSLKSTPEAPVSTLTLNHSLTPCVPVFYPYLAFLTTENRFSTSQLRTASTTPRLTALRTPLRPATKHCPRKNAALRSVLFFSDTMFSSH